ncbi:type II secretion system F family protein [Labrenzia sp. OB1]|uniref:type II secretion system F family protein n=1 Tax=Labrenzia sp. OB1 TaxID=1561204 RepID=UPI000A60A866|nr:type II secretion system F family protein [Labrenzia sp. OB1]
MKHFRYSAYRADGKWQTGDIEALSPETAFAALRALGLTPIDLDEGRAAQSGQAETSLRKPFFYDPQLIVRTMRMLAILVSRQVPVPDALALTADAETSRAGRKQLQSMSRKVAEGRSLSAAMSEVYGFASPYILSMVSAGENTATLGTVLERVADQLDKDQELKRKIKGALAYPLILIIASIGMLIFISLYMVPALMPLLEQSRDGVPGVIGFMNDMSTFFGDNSLGVLLGLVGAVAGIVFVYKNPGTRGVLEELWFRLPVIGTMLASSETVRFCSSLGLMLSNHVALVRALDISREVARTSYFRKAIESAAPALKEGQSLNQAFAPYGRFPKTFNALARAGSETRALPAALGQIADVQRAILEKQIETAVKLLPPVLTLLVGGFVGTFVLIIVDTIMSLNDAIY